MTEKTENTQGFENLIATLHQTMAPEGFRKSGNTIYRQQTDGIRHIVYFQRGQSWSSLAGEFTVELGVFIPEIFTAYWNKSVPKHLSSGICEINERLGMLGESGQDKWWKQSSNPKQVENEIFSLLNKEGREYFSQYSSREVILETMEKQRQSGKLRPRGILSMAIILAHLGKTEDANKLLYKEFLGKPEIPFMEYARGITAPLGLTFPGAPS
jgi:hypothetical protein